MNSPTLQTPVWTQPDAERLAEFLTTPTGLRLVDALRVEPSTKTPEGVDPAQQLGVIHGYRMAVAVIVSLVRYRDESPEETEAKNGTSAYPPLPPDETP